MAEPNLQKLVISLDSSDDEGVQIRAIDEPKLEKLVISLDSSDDEGVKNDQRCAIEEARKRKRNGEEENKVGANSNGASTSSGGGGGEDKYVYRTKAEEYRMLADLTNFPELAAMFALETRMNKKSRKKNQKKRKKKQLQKIESRVADATANGAVKGTEVLETKPVMMSENDVLQKLLADGAGKVTKLLETKPVMMSENDVPQNLLTYAAGERQANTCEAVKTSGAVMAGDYVWSATMIDLCLSPEGDHATADLESSRGLIKIVPTMAIVRKEEKRIEARDDTVDAAKEGEQPETGVAMETTKSMGPESVTITESIMTANLSELGTRRTFGSGKAHEGLYLLYTAPSATLYRQVL